MSVLTAVDVRSWIYELTKDEQIGKEGKGGQTSYGKANGNFTKVLSEPVLLSTDGQSVEVHAGSELVVYRKLTKRADGGWTTAADYSLAVIFIKKDGRTVEQLSVRMNGRVIRRRF